MSEWYSSQRLLRVGPMILVGAICLGLFLLFFGEFVGGIDSVLAVAIPLLVPLTVLGFLVTLIGAVGLALRASLEKLVWLGVGLIGLGVVCFIVGERLNFGFDDPGVLFMQAATYSVLIVGIIFLSFAGIRRFHRKDQAPKSEL